MKQKIRLFFICITVITVLLTTLTGVYLSYNALLKQSKGVLKAQIELGSNQYPEGIRVTHIAADGTVLYDSNADKATMDNHKNREEIKAAMARGEGSSVRHSNTVNQNTIYYATLQPDGTILRLSMHTNSAWAVLKEVLPSAVILTVILVAFVLVLTAYLTGNIIKPMEESLKNTDEFLPVYDELVPFSILLKEKNSALKSALADIKQQQQNTALITSNMSEGMIFVDGGRHIQLINPAAFTLFGIAKHDCIGLDLYYFSRDKKLAKAVKHAANGENYVKDTVIQDRILRISSSPVYDKGQYVGVISVISDVTAQRKAETIRKDFTANVSHELKTPLTSIIGYSELLSGSDAGTEDAKKFAGIINKESRNLLSLITDILKLSELEDENGEHHMQEVNILDVASECIDSFNLYAKKLNVHLTLEGTSTVITSDKDLLSLLIKNLCDNAIRYNRNDGYVIVTVGSDEKGAYLIVKDNGIGIPDKDKERIFERFYRVDKGRSHETGGTGLGLAIVKHVAEKLEASITLESTEGKGTTITVRF